MPTSKPRKKDGKPVSARTSASSRQKPPKGDDGKSTVLYHVVHAHEDFETAAEMIYEIVKSAAKRFPGKARHLYLDIDGHRNKAGGWDHDMLELQQNFCLGYLAPFLTELHVPLIAVKLNGPQRDDLPEHLMLIDGGKTTESDEERAELVKEQVAAFGGPLYDPEQNDYVHPDGTRSKEL